MIECQYNLILRINEVLLIRYPQDIRDTEIYCRASKNEDNRWRRAPTWLTKRLLDYGARNHNVIVMDRGFIFNISTTMAERIVREVATKAGIQATTIQETKNRTRNKYKITSHTLRAAGATHAISNGAKHRAVQQYGGWKSLHAFEIYIKQVEIDEEIAKLHDQNKE